MTQSLDAYGTPDGFKLWTLDDAIVNLDDSILFKLMRRARDILALYAPYNIGVDYGNEIMHDLVYSLAELIYYRSRQIRTIYSTASMERIGSYMYRRDKVPSELNIDLENNLLLWPLIFYLQDRSDMPLRIGVRVIELLEPNPITGVRSAVHGYTDRVVRAINNSNMVSDTEQFNAVVYGDRYAWFGANV